MTGERVVVVRDQLVAAFGIRGHGVAQLRTKQCPTRTHSADSCAIAADGRWSCFACGTAGDGLDWIAAEAGLDIKRDFAKVLERAAGISGEPSPDEQRAREARRLRDEDAARHEDARRARARSAVASRWTSLPKRSVDGERYLRTRGLDPLELVLRGTVRFLDDDPTVSIRDLETGHVISMATRHRDDRYGRRMTTSVGCSTRGTMIGDVAELAGPDGPDVAILVEGIVDGLTAVLVWPGCVVLAASGAGELPKIARAVAPALAANNGWLVLVPQAAGDVGERRMADALLEAEQGGLRLGPVRRTPGMVRGTSIHLVDIAPHKDLNDAWRAGWRAPSLIDYRGAE